MRGSLWCLLLGCAFLVCLPQASQPQRKTWPKLTLALLKKTPDKEIEYLIYDTAYSRTEGQPDEYRAIMKLPKGMRMIFATTLFEGEVNNGGFHQFFWNSSGRYAQEALHGLNLIGAKHDAKLLAKAIDIQKKEQARMAQIKAKKGDFIKKFQESAKDSLLDKLDDEFYKHGDDLSKLRIRYIRSHPEAFVEP